MVSMAIALCCVATLRKRKIKTNVLIRKTPLLIEKRCKAGK
jgi:hypothetical protein